ncbi:clustered mitochondria protein isoform X2 [Nymphaea colorata]|uniref:clustered mitochondria protein isoform X2 n=1 Tax=Nymphaea colorata TaxID=210225 RepID=UPI00129E3E52|nr:clustered mitochondria protein isoform X2 [Nymphaea colorata]XP_049936428.1 clustered mitochondria protein isoform X2 [Nymphaea colorata]
MAGKSGRGKNRGRAHSSSHAQQSNAAVDRSSSNSSAELPKENGDAGDHVLDKAACDGAADESKVQEANAPDSNKSKQGEDVHLYPVSVKTQSGEKLELQLNPGDSVMDIRQFLLDAPETCFFTCYDLILHSKDGSIHHLEDYHEIAEIADITSGGCSLEMIGGLYDERSIRAHVRRARELLSLSSLHSSLSTTYALQHEANNQTVAGRAEVPELDGLGFMEEIAGSLDKLSFSPSKETKCVESIVFSSFNPVPSHRRLVGDLIYLDIETLEGHKVCITGTTRTFYVNSSLGSVLDPRPTKNSSESFTLIGLLQKISPKFKKGFREILDQKAAAHPFESVQSLLPPNSWLGTYPIPEHKRDAARAEDSLVLSYGSELIGMQRDWNEELQSCREFPHNSFQERILRDRALYKVTCDFVDAATKGAIGVINRCIPPINPTDPECFHMYVHNNIFFSFAVDSDLSLMFKSPDNSIKSKSLQDSENDITVRSTSLPPAADVKGLVHGTDEMADPKDTITGSEGQLADAKDKQADIQMTDNEQATYASANNDLRGTKAYQEADISGLHNLAMAIIDYRGHRVVAQSIIPGILQGDKSDSLLYGSVDNGKKICWNEMFHAKVLEAAKVLHIKEHSVLDGFGNPIKLAAPVECKGIIGSDDRHYLLDLMRVTPRDANYVGEGSRFCVLRPELVSSFCQVEAAERLNGKIKDDVNTQMELHSPDLDAASGCESAKVDVTKEESETAQPNESAPTSASSCEDILLNPNVLTEFPLAGCEEEIATDEALVKKAGSYLVDVVIPKFVKDLNTLEVSPMDGQTLAEALHAHGINVRYLGKIAKMTKHLPHIWDLCVTEIIVRSAKHILKDILRQCEDHELGFTMSQFLNCFLGHDVTRTVKNNISNMRSRAARKVSREPTQNSVKGQRNSSNAAMALKHHVAYAHITSEVVWSGIEDFAKHKYQFTLPDDAKLQVRKVSTIRNLCQKLGISIAARKYDLDATCPFQTSDVLDLQPVVKHSVPVCIEAKDLIETGKLRLAEGMLNEAYSLFSEAFSILQQVTGPMHREVANCCRYLAMVLYHAGDMAGAIIQQHKELIINERCLGLDHPDTAHRHGCKYPNGLYSNSHLVRVQKEHTGVQKKTHIHTRGQNYTLILLELIVNLSSDNWSVLIRP